MRISLSTTDFHMKKVVLNFFDVLFGNGLPISIKIIYVIIALNTFTDAIFFQGTDSFLGLFPLYSIQSHS